MSKSQPKREPYEDDPAVVAVQSAYDAARAAVAKCEENLVAEFGKYYETPLPGVTPAPPSRIEERNDLRVFERAEQHRLENALRAALKPEHFPVRTHEEGEVVMGASAGHHPVTKVEHWNHEDADGAAGWQQNHDDAMEDERKVREKHAKRAH